MDEVIPLVRLSDIYQSTNDSVTIDITTDRYNGLPGRCSKYTVTMQDSYSYSYTPVCDYIKYESLSAQAAIRPCKFKYNNVWYGGLQVHTVGAGVSILISGTGTDARRLLPIQTGFPPNGEMGLNYYNTSTHSILNQEIYDSLSFDLQYISYHPLNVIYNGNYVGGFEFNLYEGSRDLPGEFYVNPGNCGSCILVLWSGHGSYGNATNAGVLMIRCGYDGDNYEVTEIAKSHCETYTEAFSISLNANKTFTFTMNSTTVAAVSFKVISNNTAIINNIRSF